MLAGISAVRYNNEWRTAQNLSFLLACIGEKITIEMDFFWEDVQVAGNGTEIIAGPPISIVGSLYNPQELVYCDAPGAFNNYKVGDIFRFSYSSTNFTVTEIVSPNIIRCAGENFTTYALTLDEYIFRYNALEAVRYMYNFVDAGFNFNSLIDGELQQLKCPVAGAGFTPMAFTGITSYQIGSAEVKIIGVTAGRYQYTLKHIATLTPFFLASQYASLVLGLKPSYYNAGNCLKHIAKIGLNRSPNDPTGETFIQLDQAANTGHFGETFNGGATKYSISAFTIQKVSDSSFIPRLIFDENLNLKITVSNTTDTPFSNNNTKYCIHFCYLPESEILYQNTGRTLAQNFVYDRKFLTVGAAAANGDNFGTGYQVIKNTQGVFVSTSVIEILATIELGADAKALIQQGDFSRYLIWVTTENHALAANLSDRVPLKVQVAEFDVVTTVSDLIKCETNFIQHPHVDTSDEVTDNVEVFPVDDVAARSEFYIDLASYPIDGIKIKTIRPKILLRKAGNADIILDDFLIDVSNYPMVGLAQNIAFTQDRVFKIPAGEVRKVITIARDFAKDAVNGFTNWYINWPFMVRWEYYLQLLGLASPIPADLLDIAEPLQGLNNFWHRFTTLTGWSLKYEIDFTFEQKGDEASQSFTKTINSFDFEEGPAYDNNSIKFYDNDDNTELINAGVKLFQGWKPTRIEAVFNKVFGSYPDPDDIVIVIWMEPFEAGGTGVVRRISSKYVLDSQSWFLSTDGSGLVVVTSPVPGQYKGVALINPDVIPDYKKFRFYARLYDATDYPCMVIVFQAGNFAIGSLRIKLILPSGSIHIDWGNGSSQVVNSSGAIQTFLAPHTANATYTVTLCGSIENLSHFDIDTLTDGLTTPNNFILSANLSRLESDMQDFGTMSLYSSKVGNADIIFPATNRHFTLVRFIGYDAPALPGAPFNTTLTALDFTGMTGRFATFTVEQMRALTSVTFDPDTEITTGFTAANTALNQVFDFGTKLFPQTIVYRNVGISAAITQATLDANIDNIYQNRVAYQVRTAGPKTFTANATTPAPSGTLVAPAGYIQANAVTAGNDGTPANAKEQIYVLLNQKIDFTTTPKYNWSAFNVN